MNRANPAIITGRRPSRSDSLPPSSTKRMEISRGAGEGVQHALPVGALGDGVGYGERRQHHLEGEPGGTGEHDHDQRLGAAQDLQQRDLAAWTPAAPFLGHASCPAEDGALGNPQPDEHAHDQQHEGQQERHPPAPGEERILGQGGEDAHDDGAEHGTGGGAGVDEGGREAAPSRIRSVPAPSAPLRPIRRRRRSPGRRAAAPADCAPGADHRASGDQADQRGGHAHTAMETMSIPLRPTLSPKWPKMTPPSGRAT